MSIYNQRVAEIDCEICKYQYDCDYKSCKWREEEDEAYSDYCDREFDDYWGK